MAQIAQHKANAEQSNDRRGGDAGKIVQAITGHWPEQLGDAASRNYQLAFEQIEAN